MMIRLLLLGPALGMFAVQGCGSDEEGSETTSADGATATSGSTADGGESADADTGEPDDDINCANACTRAPRCEGELVTELDCNVLCEDDDDPSTYACCLQYAAGCPEVKQCLAGTNRVCEPDGAPWVPLEMFDDCVCGDGAGTPKGAECKATGPGVPCPAEAVCLKPVNTADPPFCVVDCTLDASVCPEGTSCENTPKSRWCRNI